MKLKLSSNTSTSLSNDINNSTTTIPVASVTSFPNIIPGNQEYFYLDILSSDNLTYETVKVTGVTGLNLTVVRAQGGTTARSFVNGNLCGIRIGKAVIDDVIDAVTAAASAFSTSAELASIINDETGSGKLVFSTSPTISTSIITDSLSFDIVNTVATTINAFGAATTLNLGYSGASSSTTNIATSGTISNVNIGSTNGGLVTVNNDLTVTGNLIINGTTTTINAVTITVDDKNIELGTVSSPTNITADGGGITLKGATDKTISWIDSSSAWTLSEHIDLVSTKTYRINNVEVLSSTTLGSAVVNSSLTKIGLASAGLVKTDASGNLSVDSSDYLTKTGLTSVGLVKTDASGNLSVDSSAYLTSTISSQVSITNNTDTSSTSTGALVISGGVAINKNLLVVGNLIGTSSAGNIISSTSNLRIPISTISQTSIDSWNITIYRSVKYLIQISQGTDYQVSELLITHNDSSSKFSEFAVIDTNGILATFSTDIDTGSCRLLVTMESAASATINIVKTAITI